MQKVGTFLLKNSHKKRYLKALELMMNRFIPFNTPHKFKFHELSNERAKVLIPFNRNNKNHLGSIHACAIATLGEYCAGLSLIKRLGLGKYRLIMKEMKVEYLKQSVTELTGESSISEEQVSHLISELNKNDVSQIKLISTIKNAHSEITANVLTTWQLKNWKKVSFK